MPRPRKKHRPKVGASDDGTVVRYRERIKPRKKHKRSIPDDGSVIVRFRKVKKTPSQRTHRKKAVPVRQPRGLSPMAQYIEDNRGGGISIGELVEQFQNFDCSHPKRVVVAVAPHFRTTKCESCGKIARENKA